MMTANKLLLWMSARGQGSWQQFRAAVEQLRIPETESDDKPGAEDDAEDAYALPLYQTLRLNLQRLGHAEFFAGAGENEWRVAPPSLAATQHMDGWLGILAGARSPNLLRRIQDVAAQEKLELVSVSACPDHIRIFTGDVESMVAIANRAGLLFQQHAPAAILTSLPPVDNPSVRRPADLPFGSEWRVERYTTSQLGWSAGTREEALSTSGGLFRFSLHHRRYILFCSRGEAFQVPGQVGKYLVLLLRRRRVLRYDVSSRRLSVPASCRPPFLVERALILCSGALPAYEAATGFLHYADVPRAIAALAGALLRQQLT